MVVFLQGWKVVGYCSCAVMERECAEMWSSSSIGLGPKAITFYSGISWIKIWTKVRQSTLVGHLALRQRIIARPTTKENLTEMLQGYDIE